MLRIAKRDKLSLLYTAETGDYDAPCLDSGRVQAWTQQLAAAGLSVEGSLQELRRSASCCVAPGRTARGGEGKMGLDAMWLWLFWLARATEAGV